MIPKIVHFYWGGSVLPFLRFATVYSFYLQNPDWSIKFYVPAVLCEDISWDTKENSYDISKCKDYFGYLKRLKNVQIIPIDMEEYGFFNNISEVQKSDVLRWHLLAKQGGCWSDMDIVFFKPMNHFFGHVNNKDTFYSFYDFKINFNPAYPTKDKYGHSIGFLLSGGNNSFFQYIADEAKHCFSPTDYQSCGSAIINRLGGNSKELDAKFGVKSYNIPMDVVYAYNALYIFDIYDRADLKRFTDSSIGLHWYAGNPRSEQAVNTFKHDNLRLFNNNLAFVLRAAFLKGTEGVFR